MTRRFIIPTLLCAVFIGTGCTTETPTGALSDAADVELQAAKRGDDISSDQNSQLAELRRLTAPFHNFSKAQEAGWSVQFTPCLSNPAAGGMGFHFGNPAYVDEKAVLLEPELLLYEPQKNGKLRFVGVEYIIPFSEVGPDSDAPTLLGHEFHQVPDAGLWGLHVWIGRHNPSGMFMDWNPLVTCEYAGS